MARASSTLYVLSARLVLASRKELTLTLVACAYATRCGKRADTQGFGMQVATWLYAASFPRGSRFRSRRWRKVFTRNKKFASLGLGFASMTYLAFYRKPRSGIT
jgi:hypothetical protein